MSIVQKTEKRDCIIIPAAVVVVTTDDDVVVNCVVIDALYMYTSFWTLFGHDLWERKLYMTIIY